MALRVLLADESISIKKVIQLSLQDYGIEVKSVPVGIDVPEVARSFEPDVIFIDILLSKKSGYDVAKELKAQDATKHIPIVLMWSGFMELDPKKAADAQADGQLEKPFDADQLRTLVKKLVPRLAGNTISSYLQFPQRPEIAEDPSAEAAASADASTEMPPPAAPAKAPATPAPKVPAAKAPAATVPSAQPPTYAQPPKAPAPPAPKAPTAPSTPAAKPGTPVPKAPAPAAEEYNSDSFALMDEVSGDAVELVEMDTPEGLQTYPTESSTLDIAAPVAGGEDLPFLAEMDEPEDFQQVPLPRARGKQPLAEEGDESWMESKLSDFLVEIPEDVAGLEANESDLTSSSIAVTGGETEVMLMDLDKPDWNDPALEGTRTRARAVEPQTSFTSARPTPSPAAPAAAGAPRSSALGRLSEEKVEAIAREEIRAQTQQVLEDIAWKIIPEMAERIIREELAKLMKESEDLAP